MSNTQDYRPHGFGGGFGHGGIGGFGRPGFGFGRPGFGFGRPGFGFGRPGFVRPFFPGFVGGLATGALLAGAYGGYGYGYPSYYCPPGYYCPPPYYY